MSSPTDLQYTVYLACHAEQAWDAITDSAKVNQYYPCPLLTTELKEGGDILFGVQDSPMLRGKVEELIKPTRFQHTFAFEHHPDDSPSMVTYGIEPMGSMCKLTLIHSELAGAEATRLDVTGGWPIVISGLKTLLETGSPLPWPEKESCAAGEG